MKQDSIKYRLWVAVPLSTCDVVPEVECLSAGLAAARRSATDMDTEIPDANVGINEISV